MTKKMILSGFGLFLVLAVLHLGMKVHVLEDRIRALEKSEKTAKVVPMQGAVVVPQQTFFGKTTREADGREAVIIQGQPSSNSRSKVGVPWEIDRGMLFDAKQRAQQTPLIEKPEVEGEWHFIRSAGEPGAINWSITPTEDAEQTPAKESQRVKE